MYIYIFPFIFPSLPKNPGDVSLAERRHLLATGAGRGTRDDEEHGHPARVTVKLWVKYGPSIPWLCNK